MSRTLTTINALIMKTNLDDTEKHVLVLRLQNKTLKEVSQEIGLSASRAGQIELDAVRKLRHPYCWGYNPVYRKQQYEERKARVRKEVIDYLKDVCGHILRYKPPGS